MVSMKEKKRLPMSRAGAESESSQCQMCKWCNDFEFICKAYPFGIPEEIITNEVIHSEVLPEQMGDYIYEEE